MEQRPSLFGRGSQPPAGRAWQRTAFWLQPPAHALLRSCCTLRGPAGACVQLQGRLAHPPAAQLFWGCRGAAPWALAAEAAGAAVLLLRSAYDGQQPGALGLTAAVLGTASLPPQQPALLTVSANPGTGSMTVAADGAQLLTARASAPAAAPLPTLPAEPATADLRALLPAAVGARCAALCAAGAATADVAPAAQDGPQHGLFLSPFALVAATQLVAQAAPAAEAGLQSCCPGAVDCLLLAQGSEQRRGWGSGQHAAAHAADARLCRGNSLAAALQLEGVQLRSMHQASAAASAAVAAGSAESTTPEQLAYVAEWKAVQVGRQAVGPAAAMHARTSRAAAFVVDGGRRLRCTLRAREQLARGGELACMRGMQLLQAVAAPAAPASTAGRSQACHLILTALAGTCGSAPGRRAAALETGSAALLAMLRCAANELRGVQVSAGSLDAAAADAHPAARHAWDPACGAFGQQLSAGARFVPQLLPAAVDPPSLAAWAQPLHHQCWAVTGGTGALGLLCGAWLLQHQAARVVLLGRSGRLAAPASPHLMAAGVGSLCLAACDAAVAADCGAALGHAAVAGLLHAGGILADAHLQRQTPQRISAVHAPKVAGWRQLTAATAAVPLHRALLFSSIAAVTGPSGSTNYAAANAALDAAAALGQQAGLGAGAVQWGAWADVGMVASNAAVHDAMLRAGVGLVQPRQGMAVVQALLAGRPGSAGAAVLAFIPFLWGRFMQQPGNARLPYYAEFAGRAAAVAAPGSMPLVQPAAAAAAVPPLEHLLAQALQAVAAVSGASVEPQQPLVQAGVDSLGVHRGGCPVPLPCLQPSGTPAWVQCPTPPAAALYSRRRCGAAEPPAGAAGAGAAGYSHI